MLLVQNRLYASQFDYADSRYNYVLSLFLLKQRAGTLIVDDLSDLNAYADGNAPVQRTMSLAERTVN